MRWKEHSALELSVGGGRFHVLPGVPTETGLVRCDVVDDYTPMSLFTFTLDLVGKLSDLRRSADVAPHPTLAEVCAALDSVDEDVWREIVVSALNARDAELIRQRDAALRSADGARQALQRTRAQIAAASCTDTQLRSVAAHLAAHWEGTVEQMMETSRAALEP